MPGLNMLDKVIEAMKGEEFVKALRLIEELETDGCITSSVLVAKGRCIQLMDETEYSLDDAKLAFKQAIDQDPSSLDGLIELANFYYAVEGEPEKALEYFDIAFQKSRSYLMDAIVGHAKCVAEISSNDDAVQYLSSVVTLDKDVTTSLIDSLKY